jgi:excisionase family DNA binding protein
MERGAMNQLTRPKPISVTVKTAREITGLGNTTIYELIKQGKLKTVAVGRRRLIIYTSLESLIDAENAVRQ